MDVILLERIARLGQMGDTVSVKAGQARNFLLPLGKALRANEENRKGQLYGSVSTRDIADIITAEGFSVLRTQVELNHPIKTIGMHNVAINLHPEVQVTVTINIARSADEAERQAAGEDLTSIEAIYGIEEKPLSEEVFDDEDEENTEETAKEEA